MKELSEGERRYEAVMAVMAVLSGRRHAWLARYERARMEGMATGRTGPTPQGPSKLTEGIGCSVRLRPTRPPWKAGAAL